MRIEPDASSSKTQKPMEEQNTILQEISGKTKRNRQARERRRRQQAYAQRIASQQENISPNIESNK